MQERKNKDCCVGRLPGLSVVIGVRFPEIFCTNASSLMPSRHLVSMASTSANLTFSHEVGIVALLVEEASARCASVVV